MTKRKKTSKRAPFRIRLADDWLTLNRSTGQAYLLIQDPERGCKVRKYVGKLLTLDGKLNAETISRAEQFLAERAAAGSAPLHPDRDLTVEQLTAAFLEERKSFASRAELYHFKGAFKPLTELYGSEPSHKFGPLALKAVRQRMIESGDLNRSTINNRVDRIRMAFKWGAALELIPVNVHLALVCVESLRRGRVKSVREPRKVLPVSDAHVEAVLPHLSKQVAAIVQLLFHTGARCGEIVQMRPCDVDRSTETWSYRPATHKSAHRGDDRCIRLGPKARAVLTPWLLRPIKEPCFQPIEAEEARRAALHEQRTVPLHRGNVPGSNRKESPERAPGKQYTTETVRKAIWRVCDSIEIPRWSPHQLRHRKATQVNALYSLEDARKYLGHKSADMTAIYAERDDARAAELAEEIG